MSATEAATAPQPSRASGLLGLVRQLIDYGRQLATTLRGSPHPLGTNDIAQILARIARGLLRAEALEARITRTAARLDATPVPPRAPSHRRSPPTRPATNAPTDAAASGEALAPGLDPRISLPTAEQIAAEVRRRPIGAVIADICRDLGVLPSHPLWRELSVVIIRYGGSLANLVKDICDRAWPLPAAARLPDGPVSRPSPAPFGTGPP